MNIYNAIHDTKVGDTLECPHCKAIAIVNSEGNWKGKDNKYVPD